ncbi:hypothetical protein [Mameliella alba]|uniref:hypothetical protein n=1 Tax=Mameliella alba TaxID=561184 RepID=UPI0011120F25|nr:hypothetical protein [Mameliella alba]
MGITNKIFHFLTTRLIFASIFNIGATVSVVWIGVQYFQASVSTLESSIGRRLDAISEADSQRIEQVVNLTASINALKTELSFAKDEMSAAGRHVAEVSLQAEGLLDALTPREVIDVGLVGEGRYRFLDHTLRGVRSYRFTTQETVDLLLTWEGDLTHDLLYVETILFQRLDGFNKFVSSGTELEALQDGGGKSIVFQRLELGEYILRVSTASPAEFRLSAQVIAEETK